MFNDTKKLHSIYGVKHHTRFHTSVANGCVHLYDGKKGRKWACSWVTRKTKKFYGNCRWKKEEEILSLMRKLVKSGIVPSPVSSLRDAVIQQLIITCAGISRTKKVNLIKI